MGEEWEEQLKTIWKAIDINGTIQNTRNVFSRWNEIKGSGEIDEIKRYIGTECSNANLGSIGKNNGTRNVTEGNWNIIIRLLNEIKGKDQNIDILINRYENENQIDFSSVQQFLYKVISLELCTKFNDRNVLFIARESTINKLITNLNIEEILDGFFNKCDAIMQKTESIIPRGTMNYFEYNVRRTSALWYLGEGLSPKDFPTDDQPNVIFYGAPGTGKTYTVKKMIDFVCQGDTSRYEWVQFHPSYTYEDFIEGIKPVGIEDRVLKLQLVNGIFKNLCIKAKNDKDKNHKYYFIADEINRANLSAVFGEALSCIEASYRDDGTGNNLIKTQYSTIESKLISENQIPKETAYHYDDTLKESKFGIPKNVYFIGMMNDVDKSIDAFDLALRRRFKWVRKDCDTEVIKTVLSDQGITGGSIEKYIKSINSLNSFISKDLKLGKSYEFGHSFFLKITYDRDNEIKEEHKKALFENYLKPTLTEYLRSFYDNEEELERNLDEARKKFVGEQQADGSM